MLETSLTPQEEKATQEYDTDKQCQKQLEDGVKEIVTTLNKLVIGKPTKEYKDIDDWIDEQLDVRYEMNSRGEFVGATVCCGIGGPGYWVDVENELVTGNWADLHAEMFYQTGDNKDIYRDDLYDRLEELFGYVKQR